MRTCRYCRTFHAKESLRVGIVDEELGALLAGEMPTDVPENEIPTSHLTRGSTPGIIQNRRGTLVAPPTASAERAENKRSGLSALPLTAMCCLPYLVSGTAERAENERFGLSASPLTAMCCLPLHF